jgi:hypothetical protein
MVVISPIFRFVGDELRKVNTKYVTKTQKRNTETYNGPCVDFARVPEDSANENRSRFRNFGIFFKK